MGLILMYVVWIRLVCYIPYIQVLIKNRHLYCIIFVMNLNVEQSIYIVVSLLKSIFSWFTYYMTNLRVVVHNIFIFRSCDDSWLHICGLSTIFFKGAQGTCSATFSNYLWKTFAKICDTYFVSQRRVSP